MQSLHVAGLSYVDLDDVTVVSPVSVGLASV